VIVVDIVIVRLGVCDIVGVCVGVVVGIEEAVAVKVFTLEPVGYVDALIAAECVGYVEALIAVEYVGYVDALIYAESVG
jgi:hypothetical protein